MIMSLLQGSPVSRNSEYYVDNAKGCFVLLKGHGAPDNQAKELGDLAYFPYPLEVSNAVGSQSKNADCKDKFATLCGAIESYMEKKTPDCDFFVCFLQAESEKFGTFKLQQKPSEKDRCSKNNHSYGGNCQERRISDLVREIQQAVEALSGKPKIFIIETRPKVVPMGGTLADQYIPRGSDTFIFYNHSESGATGFCLITKFLESLKKPRGDIQSVGMKLNDELKEFLEIGLEAEWMFDNFFVTLSTTLNAEGDTPHISSTLRHKLSVKKCFIPTVGK